MRLLKMLIPLGTIIVLIAVIVPIAVVFTRSQETNETPLVNTTVGLIRGFIGEDDSALFLGIPYAIVNESNPFGAAISNPIFEGEFNAINDNARCPQLGNPQNMSLDCLHLNIHVPKTNGNEPLPVFVFIHGGAFTAGASGNSNLGQRYMIRHNVIFVSLNYRLGPYGFMCLHVPEAPGNQGLKDQLLALRWIKNNIGAFGGDVDSITIAGDSAGAMAVDSHLLFAEDDLFHKVIAISGTSLTPTAYPPPDLDAAIKMANQMGFATNDTSDAISFLSDQPPTQVVIAGLIQQIMFRPCVEVELPNVERYVTSHPVSTPALKAKNIPLIAGYTEDEWLIAYLNMPEEAFETLDIFNQNIRSGFVFDADHDEMTSFVRRFYAGDEPMSFNLRRAVIDFDSDCRFNHPTQRTLAKYLEYGGVAYHYVFTYIGGRNMQRVFLNITEGGATHSDDLGYFLDIPALRDVPTTPEDDLMLDRISTLWTNFAKYGNPTPSITEQLPVQWLPVTADHLNYLDLTLDLEIRTRPFHQRLSFWDFFYHTNREYVWGYSNETLFTN